MTASSQDAAAPGGALEWHHPAGVHGSADALTSSPIFPSLSTPAGCQAPRLLRTFTRLIRTCERHIQCRRASAWSGNYQRMPLCPSLISTRTGFISLYPRHQCAPSWDVSFWSAVSCGKRPFTRLLPTSRTLETSTSTSPPVIFNQNQLITNFNLRMGAKLMLFGFYTLSYADSNTAASRSDEPVRCRGGLRAGGVRCPAPRLRGRHLDIAAWVCHQPLHRRELWRAFQYHVG